ncbi:MAG: hypothetical protein ACK4NY_24135 [Spirosomataceae bacterium]
MKKQRLLSKQLYPGRLWISLSLLLVSSGRLLAYDVGGECYGKECIEKKKSVTFSYSVSPSDKVSLNNQFGDIKVNHWDRNEVKVDVVITALGTSLERAENYMSTVDVQGKKENGVVSIKTHISKEECTYNNNVWRWEKGEGKEDKNCLRIDYQVYMPKSNALALKNSFGNTTIPSFTASLMIDQNYGTLTTEDIRNANADVDVSFGKAIMRNMAGGKLKVSYSQLTADRIDDLEFTNSFGKLYLKEVGAINAKISYSSGTIDKLTKSAKMRLEFSSGLKFGSVARSVKDLEISASYSPVVLAFENDTYEFDVKTNHSSFSYPKGETILFSKNSEDEARNDKKYHYNPSKAFAGKIGKGSPTTRVVVNSTFSSVSFK